MKVLSLLQPWATLVVTGAKKIETRSWRTNLTGPLLIHASAGKKALARLTHNQVNAKFALGLPLFDDLPFGAIVGKVDVKECVSTDTLRGLTRLRDGVLTEQEIALGDYSPGRYGWTLENPIVFDIPIPSKGNRMLWNSPVQVCRQCGCHDLDCRGCIERTGAPCSWVGPNQCSACFKPTVYQGLAACLG